MCMKFVLKIAGISIEVHHKYDFIRKLCQDYLSENQDEYDFSVHISEEDIKAEMEMSENRFSEAVCESTAVHRAVVKGLVPYGIILMHSAVIAVDEKAYVFMAKSGVGKSTHIRLWLKHFGDRAIVVNGDKPMFAFEDSRGLVVYGSPWRGKELLGENLSMPVAAICLLERGERNEIRQASSGEIVERIFHQVLLPKTQPDVSNFINLLNRIVREVPFYKLKCNMEDEAAVVSYEGMQKS